MARHPLGRVKAARRALLAAREEYVEAVVEAYENGQSPTNIASAADVTEGAIRQMVKRRDDG